MLTNEQVDALNVAFERIAEPITEYLIRDIARRVAEAGQLTSTASYQVWRLQNLGVSQRQMKKELKKLLKVKNRELRQLLTQAAEVGYNFDIKNLPQVQSIPFEQNASVQQIVSAALKLADEDFQNITQTIGFKTPDGSVHPLLDAYQKTTDYAFKKVITGATDYNTAIRQACKELAAGGIKTIDYASGVTTTLEAAIRRNMMGGLGLMVEQISQKNHDDLGCDGWELSAHANSAPDHEPFQGKQYTDEQYKRLNESLHRRIGTLNCGHNAFPIILGVNQPQYTKAELEKFRTDNEEGVTIDGKHYTGYEATQMQRKLERSIRAQKRRVMVAEAQGDNEALTTAKVRQQVLKQQYVRFSNAAGLRTEDERLYVAKAQQRQAPKAKPTPAPKPAPAKGQTTASKPKYTDITGKWYPDAKPNSHAVQDLTSITIDGVTYEVDGHNVVLDYSAHEKEIAELLEREVGGEIFMVPRVNNPQGVSTPDYLFHGKKYDLKTLRPNARANTIFNRVKNAKGQSTAFIIDVTVSGLDDKTIDDQIEKLFGRPDTDWVDEIIIIRDGTISKVTKRA